MQGSAVRRTRVLVLPALVTALVTALALAVAGCGASHRATDKPVAATDSPTRTDAPTGLEDVAMPRPGKVKTPLFTQDLLVFSQDPLPKDVVTAIKGVKGVQAAEQFSMASFYVEEQQVTYAAINPDTFRRYLPAAAAQDTEVWDRVADGELGVTPTIRDAVAVHDDTVQMGNGKDAPLMHIGALTPLNDQLHTPFINAVVNEKWGPKLHMPTGNALLISTGNADPVALRPTIAGLAGDKATVLVLGPGRNLDPHAALTAVLTGGSVAQAVGSFTYTVNPDGSVNPDPRWIRDYIRTEQVPILGAVRCNKAMLPQLRAALQDVVKLGLASKIHPNEYGGCYVPRYIGHDPSQGLSFHTWGTAIDLNVAENQRGTAGTMDRNVVAIFRKWGFNWGGTWRYTDPMHFEMAQLVAVR
ncbi:M15 family metallopeptidase [Nocardioides pocheonensis]|uniref:M15 family peptidase n=1 Tax=Nocardioides pocheonensis TaxID=661485 RepID=A0A3N0GKL4_9ACTN|nr:M15 family metallopeptidase [Nocardioides pocheonensis]RNM12668.1 M15 family peptidase [Nocardioides pocheonensis]